MKRNMDFEDASFKLYTVLTNRLISRQIEETVLNGNVADLFPEYKAERLRQQQNIILVQGAVALMLASVVTLAMGVNFIPKLFNPLLDMPWVYGVAFLSALPFYIICLFLSFVSKGVKGYLPKMQLVSVIICFSVMGLLVVGFTLALITS